MTKVIDTFIVNEAIARNLSELLIKQTIRQRLLQQALEEGNTDLYDKVEEMLIPVVTMIESIKTRIGSEFVPEQYRDSKYSWNYNGWEIDRNAFQILTNVEA